MSTPHVSGTTVTLEPTLIGETEYQVVVLENPDAPEGYQRVVAGRIINGHFQAVPLMDFALSPVVLRKIADLLDPVP